MRILVLIVLLITTAGCGQKGDLYLPKPDDAPPPASQDQDTGEDEDNGEG